MNNNQHTPVYRLTFKSLHYDAPLFLLIMLLMMFGLAILYSASSANHQILLKQIVRLSIATIVMLTIAFIPPHKYKAWTPFLYSLGLILLIAVMIMGKIGKGAQRWLDLGFIRFQPSEIMKIAVPMMTAWYLSLKDYPIKFKHFFISILIIFIPALLIIKQPDLGTGLMIAMAGVCVVFVSGLSSRIIFALTSLLALTAPVLWHYLHAYQKQRILTLLNPEKDPLGSGYHIIQSKIAIGSGGLMGKGWLEGSQSHLNFLPEHATDFIFAVNGEEFGFIGGLIIIVLIALISIRGLLIATKAQTMYSRVLAASISMTFFLYGFVNMGMVMGILPVVGVPLPLVSYGGTAMVTFMASFGILMSISSHKILFNKLD